MCRPGRPVSAKIQNLCWCLDADHRYFRPRERSKLQQPPAIMPVALAVFHLRPLLSPASPTVPPICPQIQPAQQLQEEEEGPGHHHCHRHCRRHHCHHPYHSRQHYRRLCRLSWAHNRHLHFLDERRLCPASGPNQPIVYPVAKIPFPTQRQRLHPTTTTTTT